MKSRMRALAKRRLVLTRTKNLKETFIYTKLSFSGHPLTYTKKSAYAYDETKTFSCNKNQNKELLKRFSVLCDPMVEET